MTGYTKLFNSIVTSAIWGYDSDTRVVWITMLAMADKNGMVEATAPGLARMAGVPEEKVKQVLDMLSNVDPVSRSLDNEGKRIERVNGGYTLLNYKKYRLKNRAEDRKVYMRRYMRDYMQKRREAAKVKSMLDAVNQNKPIAEAEAYTYTLVRKEGVVGGGNQSSINPQSEKSQKPRKLKHCPIPECNNPVPAGELYCSDLHKEYAERLLAKQNRGAS